MRKQDRVAFADTQVKSSKRFIDALGVFMKKLLITVAVPLIFIGFSAYAASKHAKMPDLMAGHWYVKTGEAWTEEVWLSMRDGKMLGVSRNGLGSKQSGWEMMRIERGGDGVLTFYASPNGKPAVPFRASSENLHEIIFANTTHDYPQRIRYWHIGTVLHAEISRADGRDAMQWTYRRMPN